MLRPPLDLRTPLRWAAVGALIIAGLLAVGPPRGWYAGVLMFAGAMLAMLYGPLWVHHSRGAGSRPIGRVVGAVTVAGAFAPLFVTAAFEREAVPSLLISGALLALEATLLETLRRRAG